MKLFKNLVIATALLVGTHANAGLIEGFESGSWGSDWNLTSNGTIASADAHDGLYGVSNPGWTYNENVSLSAGDVLTSWFKFDSNGRFYLSFGADNLGAHSLVFAANTGTSMWQDNPGYGYNEYDHQDFTWEMENWYLAEISFGANDAVTGNLYDTDGTSLLRTMNTTRDYTGGIAVRAFGGVSIDTICLNGCSSVNVPEPSTFAIFALGLMGLASRRFKKRS